MLPVDTNQGTSLQGGFEGLPGHQGVLQLAFQGGRAHAQGIANRPDPADGGPRRQRCCLPLGQGRIHLAQA